MERRSLAYVAIITHIRMGAAPLTPTLLNKSHSSADHPSFHFGPFRDESATVRGQNTDNQAPMKMICPVPGSSVVADEDLE
jgi:hypothetical protein